MAKEYKVKVSIADSSGNKAESSGEFNELIEVRGNANRMFVIAIQEIMDKQGEKKDGGSKKSNRTSDGEASS